MDMSPNKEPRKSSVTIAKSIIRFDLNIPRICDENKKLVLLLTDFKEKLYMVRLISEQ